ncbi:MAG: hypothetical protein ISS15_09515 [Alphaproteobacteria bacterium]|nr:hypothetical protein [Alphaproteobacteria bacterium]MBL6938759.1 hypothetical protein [Alphaproteobacteria bacterium]MBL7097884.1 hypothetical protein [Alphaproteobacteria bacterium]
MPTPKERLTHLLELAASGAAERGALAGEVADLLLDWPAQYPAAMRATFEALLEKIIREMDARGRMALAVRFEGREGAPLGVLNALFLEATPAAKESILARNDAAGFVEADRADCAALLTASRTTTNFAPALGRLTGVPDSVAEAAMADPQTLAVLAKGAGVNRATFSAVAILTGPPCTVQENFAMLTLFDQVPENGARRMVQYWRGRCGVPAPVERAA